MIPSDTDPAAADLQIRLLREAGPAKRAALTLELSAAVIEASRMAIRRRHPELTELEVKLLWAEIHYGKHLIDPVRAALRQDQPG